MDKMQYPRGLIRFDTQNGMAQHLTRAQRVKRIFRPRVLVYTSILMLLVGALATSIALRSPFRVDVVRDRASLARLVDDGQIENVYRLQIMNATEEPQQYRLSVKGLPGIAIDGTGDPVEVGPAQARWIAAAVRVPPQTAASVSAGAHPIEFEIERLAHGPDAPAVKAVEKSTFVLPR
jgi:polyferredoxin